MKGSKNENMDIFVRDFMNIASEYSPNIFINKRNELIVEPKNNIYFRLDDVKTELDFKCKIIAWLSRPSCKGVSNYWQKRIRNIFNKYMGTDFNKNEMELIYSYLGNDCNRKKSIEFINGGFDLGIILEEILEVD